MKWRLVVFICWEVLCFVKWGGISAAFCGFILFGLFMLAWYGVMGHHVPQQAPKRERLQRASEVDMDEILPAKRGRRIDPTRPTTDDFMGMREERWNRHG